MNNTKTFVLVILIVMVLAGGLIFLSVKNAKNNRTETAQEDADTTGTVAGASTQNIDAEYTDDLKLKLANFMTAKGMVMYGAYWCPHCSDQKKLFGDAISAVDYVECDAKGPNANPDECTAKGIEGYPTWIYQGQKYSGYKSLSELAAIVGFSK